MNNRSDADLGGYYARDTHRGGYGDDFARERKTGNPIRDELCARLAEHSEIDASEIDVEVVDGAVTLSGTVNSSLQKQIVLDMALACEGVTDVRNQLQVTDREVPIGKASE